MEHKEFDESLKKAIALTERKSLKKELQNFEEKISKPKKINWFVAASITLLIGVTSYFFINNITPTNKELFATYYKPFENVAAPIVRSSTNLNQMQKAFTFYDAKQYEKAIESFQKLNNLTDNELQTINFYKAICYLELKDLKKAEAIWLKILKSENDEWKYESLWYLSLLEIKLNNYTRAINYLEKLEKLEGTFKKNEVKKLLNTLK